LISASLLASIDFNEKIPEQFRLGMSKWTDSDSQKANYDVIEPQKKHQKLNSVSVEENCGEYFEGICPPKYSKEHEVGSFNFSAVLLKMSVALGVKM